jgi:hypothetical protein
MQHRSLLWVLGLVSAATAIGLGCGGASATDVTTAPPGDGGLADGASSSGASSSGASSSSGGSSSGSVGPDGGLNPPDAGPGGTTSQITCGATSCAIATEVCCVSRTNAGTAYGCATGTTCPGAGGGDGGGGGGGGGGGDVVALKCSGAANCAPGTVCCVDQTNNGATSACLPSCGQGQAQLCDPTAGTATGCAVNQPCSSNNIGDWGLPRTYATCGGKGN